MLWLAKQQLLLQFPHRLLLPSFRSLFPGLRPFSNTARRRNPPPPPPPEPAHFMVNYLVDYCGLSRTEAVKASRYLVHVKSPEKPDAVLRLLKEECLSEAHIRRLVVSFPAVLVADAKKTLEPKIRALQEAGFVNPELAQIISANPIVIRQSDVVSKIDFWRKMLGDDKKVLKILKSTYLLGSRMDGKVNTNLSYLRSVGMSDHDIARIVGRKPQLVSRNLNKIMSIVEQVKSLGIPPGSRMFVAGISNVSSLSQSTLEAKSKVLRSFGWSGDDLVCAFRTFPSVLTFSEKKLVRAMNFLLKEAGCQPSYVAQRAVLLGYSIDRRLIPRSSVLQFLKKKGLPGGNGDLFAAMQLAEEKFVEKYVAPIRENIPELLETFPGASAMISAM